MLFPYQYCGTAIGSGFALAGVEEFSRKRIYIFSLLTACKYTRIIIYSIDTFFISPLLCAALLSSLPTAALINEFTIN